MNNAESLFNFFTKLNIAHSLPVGIEILNPYNNREVLKTNRSFYNKYYNDSQPRILLLGINPGRFGAGITGIAFTDPIALENKLNIPNSFDKKPELSASFIHQLIEAYGSPEVFFSKFLLSAICPLGFIKNGVNINYYDDKNLQSKILPFIKQTLIEQHSLTGKIDTCVCIGQGKNLKFLEELNKEINLFKKIIPIGHPRWIMQYRRKKADVFIKEYVKLLSEI